MKYVRTGFRTGAEHIHLGNTVDLYTAVGYRWPWGEVVDPDPESRAEF